MKYSSNFNRDFEWYFKYKKEFNFSGSEFNESLIVYDKQGYSAKEAFYIRDSTGKVVPTKHPKLLKKLYMCKASINFHLKLWASGIKESCFFFI